MLFSVVNIAGINAKAYSCLEEGFYTFSSALGGNKVLDVQWGSDELGANLQIYDNNKSAAQKFYVSQTDDGYYTIKSVSSGQVLDVSHGRAFLGANVWQWGENGTDAQKWTFEFSGNNTVNIKSKLGDYYLDVEGGRNANETNVRLWGWNGTAAQAFKAEKLNLEEAGTVSEKTYPQRRMIKLRDKFLDHYKKKKCKNALVIARDKFFKDFQAAFRSQKNFTFDRVDSIGKIKNIDKYDLIINEKYDTRFLNILFPDKEVESFRSVYRSIICEAAIDYLKSNNIPVFFFKAPSFAEIKNLSEVDRKLLRLGLDPSNIKNSGMLDTMFGNAETCKKYYTSGEFSASSNVVRVRNHFALADFKGNYCNIIGHARYIPSAPESYRNTIYMYGPCTMRSKYVSDDFTIGNFIQKRINKDFGGKYNVVAYGCESDEVNDFEYILDTAFKPGDIVIEERDFSSKLKDIIKEKGYSYKEISAQINNLGLTNFVVNDVTHVNHRGCKMIADFIYDTIKSKISELLRRNFEDKIVKFDYQDRDESFIKDNPDFKPYLENLEKVSKPYRSAHKKIGSLNVNCNPFTRGHRYLIEEALKRVDHLFLFVVEEDASEFSFDDRYEMVRRGVADLMDEGKITLLTTGKWMCSKFTFPDYFDKDNLQTKVILNPTKDVDLYGAFIAPAIGATRRFFGEEPIDKVTQQHNNFMKRQLPEYGIEVIEIPRKELSDGQVISASKVRKHLKEKNWEDLEKLVPQTTYDYLKEHYDRIIKRLS